MSDLELMREIAKGCPNAFNELYERYRQKAAGIVIRIIKTPSLAEEVIQDAFIQVWKKAHSFRGDSKVSSWMYRVIYNTALMRLRLEAGKAKEIPIPLTPESFNTSSGMKLEGDPDGMLSTLIQRAIKADCLVMEVNKDLLLAREIQRLFDTLPEEDRELIHLRACDEVTNIEMAKKYSLTLAALKSRLLRARKLARKRFSSLVKELDMAA